MAILLLLLLFFVIGIDCQQRQLQQYPELVQMNNCFVACVAKCEMESNANANYCAQLEPTFSLIPWNCREKCQYNCIDQCTNENVENGGKIWKFLGKWPQLRILGLQEPASTIFSILNGLVHLWYFPHFFKRTFALSPYTKFFHLSNFIAMFTWSFSAAFHARDTSTTEFLDYMGANFHIFFFTYCSVVRALDLMQKQKRAMFLMMTVVFVAAVSLHWWYMFRIKLDYGLNMKVMVVLMLIQSITMIQYARLHPTSYNWLLYSSNAVMWFAAIVFEVVFDFPPIIKIFDAHSIWHGITPFPIAMFYKFLLNDLQIHAAQQRGLPWSTTDSIKDL